MQMTIEARRAVDAIPGWFQPVDRLLFEFFLGSDNPLRTSGNLVEMGVFQGKSAVLIGAFRRPDERFYAIDLFDSSSGESEAYKTFNRVSFEKNYLSALDELPDVVEGPSSEIVEHVPAGSARFVHIDASHLYEHVTVDIDSAEAMLQPRGVVAFDDYRSPHTPGVAAAVWAAVAASRLTPVCLTRKKLYAVFGDASEHLAALRGWVESRPEDFVVDVEHVMGHELLRLGSATKPAQNAPAGGGGDAATAKALAAVAKQLRAVDRRLGRVEASLAADRESLIRTLGRTIAKRRR